MLLTLRVTASLIFLTFCTPLSAQAYWFFSFGGGGNEAANRAAALNASIEPRGSQGSDSTSEGTEPLSAAPTQNEPQAATPIDGAQTASQGIASTDQEAPTDESEGDAVDIAIYFEDTPEVPAADAADITALRPPSASTQQAGLSRQEQQMDFAAVSMSSSELDRVLPSTAFDMTYDLADGTIQPALRTFPIVVYVEVEAGDTLSGLFQEVGISTLETMTAARSLQGVFNIGSFRPGQVIQLELDGAVAPYESNRLRRMSFAPTNLEMVEVVKAGDVFESSLSKVELKRLLVHAKGSLASGSIYVDGAALNIEGSMIANFVNALDGQINFSKVQSVGDEIEMVYEAYFNEAGDLVDAGNVLYAAFRDAGGKDYEAFRFKNAGKTSYYTRDAKFTGQVSTLMKKPVGGGRMSSPYGMRIHPVTRKRKMHTGVDYAASCGTPVYAAGDGVITFASWKGGYGRFVSVKHGPKFSTNYAHLKSFASGIRPGTRVRKGQLIARVGTTGVSTGCHLHFEVVQYGKKINPLSTSIPRGGDLAQKATRARFQAFVAELDGERATGLTLSEAIKRFRQP